MPWCIGKIVTLVSKVEPDRFLADTWPWLVAMTLLMLVARPGITFARYLVTNQAMAGPFSNLIRWQSHWHVVRQSWAFFQNDFAGRISNRVMQTGPAVRESLVSSVTAVWYIVVYGITALIMMAAADLWLATPVLVWFAGYIALLVYFVPRMRDRSKVTSEARSALMGRIVDSYTNILTVKLFARPRDEDDYVRDAVEYHTGRMQAGQRLITAFGTILAVLNGRAGRRLRRDRAGAMASRQGRGRRHRHGAAADLPAHRHVALDRLRRHRDFRGDRRGAGGHDVDRACRCNWSTARTPSSSWSARAASSSRTCGSATAATDRPAKTGVNALMPCSTASRSTCAPARRSAWSAAPAPASRRWSTCCCASSTSKAAAS